MNVEIAQQVSLLLKEKTEYEQDLSEILNKNCVLGFKDYRNNKDILKKLDKSFYDKIKYLLVLELNNKIEELDLKIKQLKYF